MGNVGRTQGMEAVVRAFEADPGLAGAGAELVIAGSGVALESVREAVTGPRVLTPGVLGGDELDGLLMTSQLGLVSQKAGLREFNLPSKLMNYMSFGLPVIASVDSGSETARIVRESGAGWVTDPARPGDFASLAATLLGDGDSLEDASAAGMAYSMREFHPEAVSRSILDVLASVAGG
jgi:colanic acid biosynthesis glycosyl transferase WcaI